MSAPAASGRESVWAVVLAGGIGSRFWPMSTPSLPKQLLPLVDDEPLLANTLARLAPLADATCTLVLTNETLRPAVRALAPQLPAENVIAEPRTAGTGAALAWAAVEVARRGGDDAVMLCVHADWAIGDADAFRAALRAAARAASTHRALVTVGIVPSRDDPGFGYIQPDGEVEPGVARVARFVEKPSRERAAVMRRDGYLWNSGIFAWKASDFLAEAERVSPELAPALRVARDDVGHFFETVTPITVDHGVLERSDRVLVLRGDFGWDDVGTWGSLGRVRETDTAGNALSGPVHVRDGHGNVVHANAGGNAVVLYGVSDLVVVSANGVTLVTTVDRSSDLKTLIDSLPDSLRRSD